MLHEKLALTPTQMEVLAALFAYDEDGQRHFQNERMKKSHWRKAVGQIEALGLAVFFIDEDGHGEWLLTPAGEDRAKQLPKGIWSTI